MCINLLQKLVNNDLRGIDEISCYTLHIINYPFLKKTEVNKKTITLNLYIMNCGSQFY